MLCFLSFLPLRLRALVLAFFSGEAKNQELEHKRSILSDPALQTQTILFYLFSKMHYLKKLTVLSILMPVIAYPQADLEISAGQAEVLVIENVTVVPMDTEQTLPNRTVLIREGRIEAIRTSADELEVPEDALHVDGSGKYLMPGLAEMHGHLPTQDQPPGFVDDVLGLLALRGVMFVRSMQGAADHPRIRDEIAEGKRFGPTLRVASPGFGGGVQDPEQARSLVRTYHQDGFDLLKIHEGMGVAAYQAMAEEARELGIPFAGHISDSVGLLDSLEAGHRTIDHIDNYIEALRTEDAPNFSPLWGVPHLVSHLDRERIPELVEATLEAGAGIVPTMAAWKRVFDNRPVDEYLEAYPELKYLPSGMVNGWVNVLPRLRGGFDEEAGREVVELRDELLLALHEGGIPILLGSDAPQFFNVPGFSVHHEMQHMQDEVGMSPYEVLVSGTRGIAEFYGESDEFGTVTEGSRADLILVNANPLEDVAHAREIAGVVLQGKWLPADEIQSRLDEIEQRRQ